MLPHRCQRQKCRVNLLAYGDRVMLLEDLCGLLAQATTRHSARHRAMGRVQMWFAGMP